MITIKTVIYFIVGIAFIIANVLLSVKRLKEWKSLSLKQKIDAGVWVLIGILWTGILATVTVLFLIY